MYSKIRSSCKHENWPDVWVWNFPAPCWTGWAKSRTPWPLHISARIPRFYIAVILRTDLKSCSCKRCVLCTTRQLCSSHISQFRHSCKNENWPDVRAGASPATCWTRWGKFRNPWPLHSSARIPRRYIAVILRTDLRVAASEGMYYPTAMQRPPSYFPDSM